MRNFRIVIQYEGTRYQGWQRQGTTQNTLQGKFEALLSKIAGTPVEIQASGRTDAGVHALGQTANFHMNTELSCEELLDKLNQYLPEDVAVISCQEAAPRFHARLNAVGKTYCYRIHNSKIPAVFDRRLVWQIEQQLDVDAMKTAAKYLVGTHDFAAFTSAKNKKKSTVRSIESILFEQNGADIRISFRGDGFLFHMVRILTGTILTPTNKKSSHLCESVRRYIDANCSEDISLEQLAQFSHVNKYYLVHAFSNVYGISPINYLMRARVEKAKTLLSTTDFSLSVISRSCGFSSSSYFSQTFKKLSGMSPSAFRRASRQDETTAK